MADSQIITFFGSRFFNIRTIPRNSDPSPAWSRKPWNRKLRVVSELRTRAASSLNQVSGIAPVGAVIDEILPGVFGGAVVELRLPILEEGEVHGVLLRSVGRGLGVAGFASAAFYASSQARAARRAMPGACGLAGGRCGESSGRLGVAIARDWQGD